MNPTDSIHRHTWDLIPWIVNLSASSMEQERARIHLASCADCRDELALQTRIHAGLNSRRVVDEKHARNSLRKLMGQIDGDPVQSGESGTHAAAGVARSWRTQHNSRRWLVGLAAAVVVQAVGLVALGAVLLDSPGSAELSDSYATLSNEKPADSSATIRLVPSPALSVGGLQSLLDETGLQIVGSNSGATILALAPVSAFRRADKTLDQQRQDRHTVESIERLRQGPGILLAEPILAPARAQ